MGEGKYGIENMETNTVRNPPRGGNNCGGFLAVFASIFFIPYFPSPLCLPPSPDPLHGLCLVALHTLNKSSLSLLVTTSTLAFHHHHHEHHTSKYHEHECNYWHDHHQQSTFYNDGGHYYCRRRASTCLLELYQLTSLQASPNACSKELASVSGLANRKTVSPLFSNVENIFLNFNMKQEKVIIKQNGLIVIIE